MDKQLEFNDGLLVVEEALRNAKDIIFEGSREGGREDDFAEAPRSVREIILAYCM